jgi:hypothetical protein
MQTDEIDPLVPEMPRALRTDGGHDTTRRHTPRERSYDDPEHDAPLVPDLG